MKRRDLFAVLAALPAAIRAVAKVVATDLQSEYDALCAQPVLTLAELERLDEIQKHLVTTGELVPDLSSEPCRCGDYPYVRRFSNSAN